MWAENKSDGRESRAFVREQNREVAGNDKNALKPSRILFFIMYDMMESWLFRSGIHTGMKTVQISTILSEGKGYRKFKKNDNSFRNVFILV